MKKILIFMIVFLFSELFCLNANSASTAAASIRDYLGVGVMIGNPTGISFKSWMHGNRAIDAVLGVPFDSDVKFSFHADYLWQFPIHANVPGKLPFYLGFGARLRAIDKANQTQKVDAGIRIPVGIEFSPNQIPLNFFAELAPVIVFTPNGTLDLSGGIGMRYRFGT